LRPKSKPYPFCVFLLFSQVLGWCYSHLLPKPGAQWVNSFKWQSKVLVRE
jgi:carbohydrate-selective porin OprB